MGLNAGELFLVGLILVLVAVALIYLFGSFSLMTAHVVPRAGQRQASAMLRELYYVLITQPLIPLYFVLGRKMGDGQGIPVVFVHGYFQNRADFWWLARQFRRASKGPLYGFNYPWFDSVDRNVPRLGRFVERVCAETGSPQVTLVAHSLGGLVCLDYAHSAAGRRRVAHCVTIGTPHGGVKWRGPIIGRVGKELREDGEFAGERRVRTVLCPTLSVYSTHDNIVHPPATSALSARGGDDAEIDGLGHLSLLYSRQVARILIDYLDRDDHPLAQR